MLKNKLFLTMLMLATLIFSEVACGSDDETEVTEVIKEVQVPGETVIVEDQGPLKMYLLHNNDGESELLGDDEEGYFGVARFANIL